MKSFEGLENELRRKVRGEVRFDGGSRALYATDASNYRQVPIGVVIPRDVDDIVAAVEVCQRHQAPIVHRGGGTSLAGQACNVAVVIDSSKHVKRILEIDAERRFARVEPGVVLDQLRDRTEPHHLTYGPDPSTHAFCTFGGMIGNNSCGIHSQMSGRTVDNVEELDILTYDGHRMTVGPTSEEDLAQIIAEGGRRGEIYRQMRDLRDRYADQVRSRFPDIPRRVSGYCLDELLPERGFNVARALVGSEGTLVTILGATVRLVESPPHRVMLVLGYPSVYDAGDHVVEVGETGAIGLEGMDGRLIAYMKQKNLHTEYLHLLPEGDGWLIAEYGGETADEALGRAHEAMNAIKRSAGDGAPSMRVLQDEEDREGVLVVRESGLGATAHTEGGETWEGWEDSAVPPERLGDYLRDLHGLYDRYDYQGALYGHFGQACVHTRINFNLRTREGIDKFRSFVHDAADLCLRYGGSLSGEHGDGQSRGELLPKMYGDDLIDAFRKFKRIWDPSWKMNPGKIVDPFRIDDNLRLGMSYRPPEPQTHFQYPEDGGSFSKAALRCVGVGLCRRTEMDSDEVMCPSYLATREEKHTTRGRARLLFEMLNGEETPGPWRNDDVFEALDLCLACKGCKNDCPVNTDMATYKAEFLAHYYKRRPRPRHAYAFGLIYWWSRIASRMPRLVNALSGSRVTGALMKRAAGVAPQREIPQFAEQTFTDWFRSRPIRNQGRPRVLLWPDTFNNFFTPATAIAATEVLEAAGHQVILPARSLCCGRPLYDYGMIDLARWHLRQIMETLRTEIREDVPVVGLEPSCVSIFRDELVNLFPEDWDARRLSQSAFTLGEFLRDQEYESPRVGREALVHGHCHHKSVLRFDANVALLRDAGVSFDRVVPASCCGMAGAFGYEAEHYDVSIACGEHALLPAVREAGEETLLVADGFSCREQIRQTTGRQTHHLAEVLKMGLPGGQRGNGSC